MREKADIVRFVKIVKRIFLAFSVVAIAAEMILLVFAFMGYLGCIIAACAVGVGYIAIYAVYALRTSMGTVLGMEVTDKVVHVKTKRRIFTYDVKRGCVGVKVRKNRFVATFETQDSRDSFTFYRRVLFSPHGGEQFTADEIRMFYPDLDEDGDEE